MVQRTVFQSKVSVEDAAAKAQAQGFRPTSSTVNKAGYFVVFAVKQDEVRKSPLDGSWLRGKI